MVTVMNCQRKSILINLGFAQFCLESLESQHTKCHLQTGLEEYAHALILCGPEIVVFSRVSVLAYGASWNNV